MKINLSIVILLGAHFFLPAKSYADSFSGNEYWLSKWNEIWSPAPTIFPTREGLAQKIKTSTLDCDPRRTTDLTYPVPPSVGDVISDANIELFARLYGAHNLLKSENPYLQLSDLEHPRVQSWIHSQNSYSTFYLACNSAYKAVFDRMSQLQTLQFDFVGYSINLGDHSQAYVFRQYSDPENEHADFFITPTLAHKPINLSQPSQSFENNKQELSISYNHQKTRWVTIVREQNYSYWRYKSKSFSSYDDYRSDWIYHPEPRIVWHPDGNSFYYSGFKYNSHLSKYTSVLVQHTFESNSEYKVLLPTFAGYYLSIDEEFSNGFLISLKEHSTKAAKKIFFCKFNTDCHKSPSIIEGWSNNLYKLGLNQLGEYVFMADGNTTSPSIYAFDAKQSTSESALRVLIPARPGELIVKAKMLRNRILTVVRDIDQNSDNLGKNFLVLYESTPNNPRFFHRQKRIELPFEGVIGDFFTSPSGFHITLSSLLQSPHVFELRDGTEHLRSGARSKNMVNDVIVERKVFSSPDGKRLPMLVYYKRGSIFNGQKPMILYSYGGFNSETSSFYDPALTSLMAAKWVEGGGAWVDVIVRGGTELGEQLWYDGLGEKRDFSFQDYIAAAEHLIKIDYTAPKKIAAFGISNGGLLVINAAMRRPELFGAVVAGSPLTDMLKFRTLNLGGHAWNFDYGPETEENFRFWLKNSPIHNIRNDIQYPPMLLRTAILDTNVHASNSFRFVAEMQSKATGGPFLLLTYMKRAHNPESDWQGLDEASTYISFFTQNLMLP